MRKKDKNTLIKRRLSKKDVDVELLYLSTGIDFKNRVITLFGDIDQESVGDAIRGLLAMANQSNQPITIYINSFGGDPYSSFGIYDLIKSLPCPIITVSIGTSMSAGSTIFLAGDYRKMYKNSVLMVHTVASYAEGKVNLELRTEKEECDRIEDQICDILAKNSNKNKRFWKKKIRYEDNFIRTKEALELGLVDEIIEDKDPIDLIENSVKTNKRRKK